MSEENNTNEEAEEINIQELLFKYLSYWRWFILSVIICLAASFLYLKYTTPIYKVSAAIVIKDDKKGGNSTSELSVFEGMGLLGGVNNIDNEIEILKSKSLIKSVVNALQLHTTYKLQGHISSSDLYDKSPIQVTMDQAALDTLSYAICLNATMNSNKSIKVEGEVHGASINTTLYTLPAIVRTPVGKLTVSYRPNTFPIVDGVIKVTINKPIQTTKGYLADLSVAPTSKTTSVVDISLSETNRKRGENFISKLVEIYNRDAMEDKNKVAANTKVFIDERIAIIDKELGSTERSIEDYKKNQKLTDISSDTQMYLEKGSEYEKKQVEVETQLNLVSYLQKHVSDKAHKHSLVPSNVGIADPTLLATINEYNMAILERDRLLRTASENNPTILGLNGKIEGLRSSVIAAISSVRQGLIISKQDVSRQAKLYDGHVGRIPTQEREFTEIYRQQQIKSSLFLMLLQKREENSLSLAVTANSAKVIDEPLATDMPVSPKRPIIYLVALLLGLIIPIVFIYIRELLQYKISSRADVDKLSKLPVLGEIPKNYDGQNIVVRE